MHILCSGLHTKASQRCMGSMAKQPSVSVADMCPLELISAIITLPIAIRHSCAPQKLTPPPRPSPAVPASLPLALPLPLLLLLPLPLPPVALGMGVSHPLTLSNSGTRLFTEPGAITALASAAGSTAAGAVRIGDEEEATVQPRSGGGVRTS